MGKGRRPSKKNDFAALDRLPRSITLKKLRPLTAGERGRWGAAKRGKPKRRPGAEAVPTLITVEPQHLRRADAYANRGGLTRSRPFPDALR